MPCPVVQTNGHGTSNATINPVVDQVQKAFDAAYSDAARTASAACATASAFTCQGYAFAGIISVVATETGDITGPTGPVYTNRAAVVDLVVSWQCDTHNPVVSGTIIDSAKRQACGRTFTIEVTAMDHPTGAAATARAQQIGTEQARKVCGWLPCDVLEVVSETFAGASQAANTNLWMDTYTGTFRCKMRTP